MDQQTPAISIVVACRNEAAHIAAFLDSLLAQETPDLAWEAVIADGMSDDGTFEILIRYAERHPKLRVIRNQGRIVSTGLNAAIHAARGSVILRMDAHTRFAPDYCIRCLETLEATGADNVGGPARTQARGLRARAIAAAYHSPFSTGGARFHDANYEGWVDTVPYGCWRKETLLRLGLFDEALVRNQDDELNLRLTRAGGKVWLSPRIVSWYSPRTTLAGLFRQYFQYGFWKVAVIRKHQIPASWRHLVPVAFVTANALMLATLAAAAAGFLPGWLPSALWLWLSSTAAYAAAIALASSHTAARNGWRVLPYLPAVFAVFHVSYGLGFAAGLARFLNPAQTWQLPHESVYSRITR
jgi:succinoglycan biosynthesis protein ExoA